MTDSERFIKYFREQLKELEAATLSPLYKEICCVAILDALSKTIYPRENNRPRFVRFFKNFSGWQHSDKISLTHLIRLLAKAPRPEFNNLRKLAFSEMEKWERAKIIYLDQEPSFVDIQKQWPKEKDCFQPIDGVRLENIRHDNLVYEYRNSLIHELRHPGYGFNLSERDQPYYIGTIKGIDEEETYEWDLVYPTAFFQKAIENALSALEKHYVENQINPYSFFVFGTYWLEELNQ